MIAVPIGLSPVQAWDGYGAALALVGPIRNYRCTLQRSLEGAVEAHGGKVTKKRSILLLLAAWYIFVHAFAVTFPDRSFLVLRLCGYRRRSPA